MEPKKKKYLYYLFLVLIIFLIDRISKLYILNIVENSGTLNIYINSFINLILVWNSGIGFGLFSSNGSFLYNLITILIIIINLIIIYLIIKAKDFTAYFYVLVLGGSFGNLFDRLYYSAVPDFIDLNYNNFHWFIFNVADIFITIGIFCLIVTEFLGYKRK